MQRLKLVVFCTYSSCETKNQKYICKINTNSKVDKVQSTINLIWQIIFGWNLLFSPNMNLTWTFKHRFFSFEFGVFMLFDDSVILHFYSKQSESFVYMVNWEVIWLSLGKLHHWFVSYLPKAIKLTLLHTDVIVNINANVDSEITRQKAHSWKMTFRWSRIHAWVCVCECVCLYIKVAEQIENIRLKCFCVELMITNNVLVFRHLEKHSAKAFGGLDKGGWASPFTFWGFKAIIIHLIFRRLQPSHCLK